MTTTFFSTLLAAALVFFSGVLVGQSNINSDDNVIDVGFLRRWEDAAPWRHHHHHHRQSLGNDFDDFDDDKKKKKDVDGHLIKATTTTKTNKNKNNNNNNKEEDEESEEDAYKSLMEMFGMFSGSGAQTPQREAIEEPEPVLSAENKDLLKQEENHFSKIGSDLGYFRAPAIRNDTLVFVSEGSIWLSHARGGPAARISSSYSYESVPKLSPDGKRIAFLAESADGFEVFELPIHGGVARQVTHGAQAYGLPQWSSDSELLILTTQFSDLGNPQLAKVDALTGKISVLPFEKAHGGAKDTKGCYLFYPLRQSSSTKRYEGGEQARIWRWCGADAVGANGTAWAEAKELTPESWSMRGAWSPQTTAKINGKIFFISDKTGVANLWVMNEDGSNKTQLTFECEFDVMEYAIDATRIVMRVGADLKSATLTAAQVEGGVNISEASTLKINLLSEFREAQPMLLSDPLSEMSELAISDDGVYGAFVVRGQVYFSPLIAQLGTRIEKVTKYEGMVRYKHVQFIPNSHPGDPIKLLALSDAGGEYDYVVLERDDDNGVSYWLETQVTQNGSIRGGLSYSQISPDGTSLAFDDTNGHVKLVNFTNTVVNTDEFRTPASPEDEDGGAQSFYSETAQLSQTQEDAEDASSLGDEEVEMIDAASILIKRQRVLDKRTKKIQAGRKFVKADMHAPNFRETSSSSSPNVASLGNVQQQQQGSKQQQGVNTNANKKKVNNPSSAKLSTSDNNQANVRNIVSGLQPESAGEYAWSPDGTWLAYVSLFQDTDFEVIYAWNTKTNERVRITPPSSNSRSPAFSPDGLFLYYFNDAQFSSGSNSPYGSRGSEPVYEDGENLYCLPLREGLACPFFSGDELNAAGTVFDPTLGQKYPTKISTKNIEKRSVVVPFVDRARYESMYIIGSGATILLNMYDSLGSYLIAVDIMQGLVTPIYPDAYDVLVSRDLQVVVLFTEEGVALMSAQTIAETPDQDAILGQALLWLPPETWTVKVNPREEWMQMYDEGMRTMRDNFYDPNLHGVDWLAVTERYRPLVRRLTSKNELRDVLEQALGELSVLHVFVDVEEGVTFEKVGMGMSSACLGAKFEQVPQGLRVTKIYDTSEVLMAPNSPLSAMAVDLRAGDIITRIDGVLVNTLSDPLPKLLMGKANSQVLLEVSRGPRTEEELQELQELQEMIESVQQSSASLGVSQSNALRMSTISSSSAASKSHRSIKYAAPGDGEQNGPKRATESGEQYFNEGAILNAFNPLADIARSALKSNRLGVHSSLSASKSSKDADGGKSSDGTSKASSSGKMGEGEGEDKVILDRVVVVPLDINTCSALQKADALNRRKAKVRRDSNDTIGYVYLEDMVQEGPETHSMDDFASQFYPNLRKGGLIIDVRRNHGGNIDTWVLERLRRVAWMFESHRSGPGETTMQYSFRGKVVVLIDEMSSSDAELFAAGFQTMKLGKVIGARSWGGAVGYSGNPECSLVDGGSFTIPSFGPYLGNEWLIEQKGVIPDIPVANLPVESFHGTDKQLDAAIREVLKEIKASPDVKIPEHPQFPVRAYDNAKCLADQRKKTEL
jgi:C-terminal processing protease CtpA/Prc/tricorn protease-like protein